MPRIEIIVIILLLLVGVALGVYFIFNPAETLEPTDTTGVDFQPELQLSGNSAIDPINTAPVAEAGMETVINSCSPDGFSTARLGPGTEYGWNELPNGTRVEILETLDSDSYDFTLNEPGCGSSFRVLVRVLEGELKDQERWVHGSTVEGVAE